MTVSPTPSEKPGTKAPSRWDSAGAAQARHERGDRRQAGEPATQTTQTTQMFLFRLWRGSSGVRGAGRTCGQLRPFLRSSEGLGSSSPTDDTKALSVFRVLSSNQCLRKSLESNLLLILQIGIFYK